ILDDDDSKPWYMRDIKELIKKKDEAGKSMRTLFFCREKLYIIIDGLGSENKVCKIVEMNYRDMLGTIFFDKADRFNIIAKQGKVNIIPYVDGQLMQEKKIESEKEIIETLDISGNVKDLLQVKLSMYAPAVKCYKDKYEAIGNGVTDDRYFMINLEA
ncbi:MAG: hypothetical protein K2G89_01040, partial [Lachnospiraceae bacterium]|nr:hypothetical protein [Lachnospiraceae bacterium]